MLKSDVAKIHLTFLDESTETISGRLYKCTADRLAFERHYGFTFASKVGAIPEGAERLVDGERFAELSQEEKAEQLELARRIGAAASSIPEEYTAFYVWRCWSRAHAGAGKPFGDWADSLAEIAFQLAGQPEPEADADPLALAAPPSS